MLKYLETYALLLLFFISAWFILSLVMRDYRESQRIDYDNESQQYIIGENK